MDFLYLQFKVIYVLTLYTNTNTHTHTQTHTYTNTHTHTHTHTHTCTHTMRNIDRNAFVGDCIGEMKQYVAVVLHSLITSFRPLAFFRVLFIYKTQTEIHYSQLQYGYQ